MSAPDFDRLFRHATETRSLAAGETLFTEGDAGNCAWVVLDGAVDIVFRDKVVGCAEKGSLVGEMALLEENGPRSAAARAKSDAKLAPIDQKRFLFLVQETPSFAIDVMRLMADRLRNANQS